MRPLILLLLALSSFPAWSQKEDARVESLEQKVATLERKVASLERELRLVYASRETPATARMRACAAKKMAREKDKFDPREVAKVEAMYAEASRDLSAPKSKRLLDTIVSNYPHLNRAGCAQLYRAQQEIGPERERLLQDCILRFASCIYGDGAEVGPLALYHSANDYRRAGDEEKAAELYARIRKKHRKAIDHRGELLVDQLPRK